MSLTNFLTENLLLPTSDILLKRTIYKNLQFLLKSQWWSLDELNNYQLDNLKMLVSHAYTNVPYYHELFNKIKLNPKEIHSLDDLKKIPLLTKDIIRKYGVDNFKARNIKQSYKICSSGSTGEPLCYYINKEAYSLRMATNLRGLYWNGFRLGDKNIKISQNTRQSKEKKIQDWINRTKYLYSQHLTEKNILHNIREIAKYKPKLIYGYPDPLFLLAYYIKKHNIKMPSPLFINISGNILHDFMRELIEEQFNSKVFDAYSCEGAAIVFECHTSECYHSAMEYAISEIIPSNLLTEDSACGRLITTELHNFAMPFIRYDTQDIVSLSEQNCSCGRNLMGIKKIYGRDTDVLITPTGKYLIVHNFTAYFEYVSEVDQFQIIQNELDSFTIKLVVNENYNSVVEKEIYDYWMNYLEDTCKIEIQIVNTIPLSNSGKRRFLIREKNIKLNF